jgi:hypothetical protein
VNKKKQKNFFCSWAVLVSTPPAQSNQKFFAPLFFKKAAASLHGADRKDVS